MRQDVEKFEQKRDTEESDSGEGEDSDSEEDDENEDDEESEDGSENGDDSGKSSDNSKSEEEFEAGSDDDEYESESTDLFVNNVGVTERRVNTDTQKDGTEQKSVHLRIEDIDFTDNSPNKDYNNLKTTVDLTAMVDVTITDTNTENEMLSSGGNFVARNLERSATGIDFPQYNSAKDIGAGINILSNKIETAGKKESSDRHIPTDMNEMQSFDDDHMDTDPLDEQNDSDEQNLVQAREPENESDKSTTNNVDKGDKNKSSQTLNTNDSVSDTNQVDGEKSRVKTTQPVVIVKYGCKKCTKICFTESGYHTHLFQMHQICNVKNYPAQIIEGTMVNSANMDVDVLGEKQEQKYVCNECGELFFDEGSIETHKTHAHTKSIDEETSGNDAVTKTSGVTEDNRKDHDEEILEKGRNILNRMICKPGSKKKLRMTARK